MKAKFVIALFLSFVILNLFQDRSISAQEAPTLDPTITSQVSGAEDDYRNQFDLYRTAYSEYTRTKSIWEDTGTLKAEQEALVAAKNVGVSRDDVMIAYTKWLRLQLLQFPSVYDKVTAQAAKLQDQILWFENHKARVASVTDITTFDQTMAEYSQPTTVNFRNHLYSIAQLELKLANLAFFQHQARALYEPILKILETKTDIPEVTQGFVRINQLNDQINSDLVEISNLAAAQDVAKFNDRTFYRNFNERLQILQSNQINLLTFIIELESRYAR